MRIAGLFLSAGFSAFFFLTPLNRHIPAVTGVFFACFSLYLWLFVKIKNGFTEGPFKAAAASILLFSVLFRLPLFFTAPTLSDDIYRYLWDGRVQAAGMNPYVYPPAAPELSFLRDANHAPINHPAIRTVYPPLAQWVYRLGASIHPNLSTQKLLFVLFDIGSISLLLLLLRLKKRPAEWAVIYAWNPLVVVEFAGSGHNDSLMIFFLLAGFYFYERSREGAAAAGFAAALLSKLVPIVMIPWLLIRRKPRPALLFFGLIVLACLPFVKGMWDILHGIAPGLSGLRTYAKDWVFNPSIYGIFGYALPNPTARKILLGLILAAAALVWAKRNERDPMLHAFGCLYALLLAGPVVHPWYVTWIIPFLCFYPLWSGVVWSGLVFLAYVVWIRYVGEGVWQLPAWVSLVEYGAVYGLLGWEIKKCASRSSFPR